MICNTCGHQLKTHKRCDACGILIGKNHWEAITEFKHGKELCLPCYSFWCEREEVENREILWVEFREGKKINLNTHKRRPGKNSKRNQMVRVTRNSKYR